MPPLVGCPGRGGFLSGGAFVRGVFCPGALLAGGLLAGGIFFRGCFCPGGLLPGGTFVRKAYARPPKLNAYTHRL